MIEKIKDYYKSASPEEVEELLTLLKVSTLEQITEEQWQEQADWYNATWSKENGNPSN